MNTYYRVTVYCYSDMDEDDLEGVTEFALGDTREISVASIEVAKNPLEELP